MNRILDLYHHKHSKIYIKTFYDIHTRILLNRVSISDVTKSAKNLRAAQILELMIYMIYKNE
jgi:hypothetical protein